MKKLFSLALALLMLISVASFAGCGEKSDTNGKALKMGLGIYAVVDNVKNADAEAQGEAKLAINVATVLLDDEDKIVKCAIDTVETTAKFDTAGKIDDLGEVETKYELGDSYGMKSAGVAKEWYEQADAFSATVVGKTLDDVKNIKKGDADLTEAGCTIEVSEFVLALEKAVENAKDSEATAEDALNLGVASTASVTSATEESDGSAKLSVSVTAAAVSDGKIIAAVSDVVEPTVKVDAKGAAVGEYGTAVSTKEELGDNYGMSAAGFKEWYAQNDGFEKEIAGKTADEITGLADSTGSPKEALQTAGCTINVSDMLKAAVKAVSK